MLTLSLVLLSSFLFLFIARGKLFPSQLGSFSLSFTPLRSVDALGLRRLGFLDFSKPSPFLPAWLHLLANLMLLYFLVPGMDFLSLLALLLCLLWLFSSVYFLAYISRDLAMDGSTLGGWVLFFLTSLFFLLGFLRGLEGSFHWANLSPWASHRYAFFLALLVLFSLLSLFFGAFSFPPLMENSFLPLWLSLPWPPRVAVFILEKMSRERKWFWLFSLWDFLWVSFYPLVQSILFFLFAWGDFNLQFSLLLLPLSFLSLVHRILFFYLHRFLQENFAHLQSLVEVHSPFPPSPFLHQENTPFLAFSLTELGRSKNYTPLQQKGLFLLWQRAAHLQGVFSARISWNSWIWFFRILGWLLLSLCLDPLPSSSSSLIPLAWISTLRREIPRVSKRFFSPQDFWCTEELGKILEEEENYLFPHPLSGDPANDGTVELTHSQSHGTPAGAIPSGSPLDSHGEPKPTSLIPLSKGIFVEISKLTPLKNSAPFYDHLEVQSALNKVHAQRNQKGKHHCPSNPCPFCSLSQGSSPKNFPQNSSTSKAYQGASQHPLLGAKNVPPQRPSSSSDSHHVS